MKPIRLEILAAIILLPAFTMHPAQAGSTVISTVTGLAADAVMGQTALPPGWDAGFQNWFMGAAAAEAMRTAGYASPAKVTISRVLSASYNGGTRRTSFRINCVVVKGNRSKRVQVTLRDISNPTSQAIANQYVSTLNGLSAAARTVRR